jgi:hypothetical protein
MLKISYEFDKHYTYRFATSERSWTFCAIIIEDIVPETKGSRAMSEKRSWVLVAVWFGAIALLGLLKRGIDRRQGS